MVGNMSRTSLQLTSRLEYLPLNERSFEYSERRIQTSRFSKSAGWGFSGSIRIATSWSCTVFCSLFCSRWDFGLDWKKLHMHLYTRQFGKGGRGLLTIDKIVHFVEHGARIHRAPKTDSHQWQIEGAARGSGDSWEGSEERAYSESCWLLGGIL